MPRINIKPLSVNQCWMGRRYKTKTYKNYEANMLMLLPDIELPKPPFEVLYKFGFSSAASDLDNPVKPLQDILQKRYKFDDKHIHRMVVEKVKVKKGQEFLIFEVKSCE